MMRKAGPTRKVGSWVLSSLGFLVSRADHFERRGRDSAGRMPVPTPHASALHGRYRQPPGPTKKALALGRTKTTSPFLRFLLT